MIRTNERLELSQPGADRELDHYVQRLDQALPKVSARLRDYLDPATGAAYWELVEAFAALPTAERRNTVRHPFFAYWWLKVMERVKGGDRGALAGWLAEFPRFVVMPLLRQGRWVGKPVAVPANSKREIRFPGSTRHLLLPEDESGTVTLHPDGTDLVITGKGCHRVPAEDLLGRTDPPSHPLVRQRAVLNCGIELDAGDAFVGYLFDSINSRPPIEHLGAYDLRPLDPVPSAVVEHFERACDLLRRIWPELWDELVTYVQLIIPYVSRVSSTFTEAAFMGAVFMSEARQPFADEMYTAEHLLHEHSHLRLTLILETDPLYRPHDSSGVYRSPFRRDPRPLSGILQGAFVFFRIAEFLTRSIRRGEGERYRIRLSEVVRDLDEAVQVLEAHATFTDRGQTLIASMKETVVSCRAEFGLV